MPNRTSFTPSGAVAVVSTGAISFLVSALLDWSIGWRLLAMTLAIGAVVALLTLRPLARMLYPRLATLSPTLSGWLKRTVEEEHTPTQKAVWLGSAGGAAILCFGVLLFGPGGLTDVSLAGLALSCAGIFAYYASKMCPRRSRRGLASLALAGWFVSLSANFVANAAGGPDAGASRGGAAAPDRALRRDIAEFERAVERGDSNSFFEAKGPLRFAQWSADAERGIAMAQYFTAWCLYYGCGVPANPPAAVPWVQRAAGQDCADAMVFLGYLYDFGLAGIVEDDQHAAALYRSAAELNNRAGMNNLGVMYRYGLGGVTPDGRPDIREAIRWYERAADLGLAMAMRNLGEIHADGVPPVVRKDPRRGERWYARAASAGDLQSQGVLTGLPMIEAIEAYAAAGGDTRERARALKRFEAAAARVDALGMEAHVGMLSYWRMTNAVAKLNDVPLDDPVRAAHARMLERAIELYRGAPRSQRQRALDGFTRITLDIVVRWHATGQHERVADFYEGCLADLSFADLVRGERDALILQLRACILSLYHVGRRPEARRLLDVTLDLIDRILADRPWDWYVKTREGAVCFDAAKVIHDLGDRAGAQPLLMRAWTMHAKVVGQPDIPARYAGRLPLKGGVPPGVTAVDRLFFESYDDVRKPGEPVMKRISVELDFDGVAHPFDLYIVSGPNAYAEAQDQLRWAVEYRGATIPERTSAWLREVQNEAIASRRAFQEVCLERIGPTP